ncbi:hypothetical protein UFOVP729_21 [uncultured Caudovirales phage]|uniref:Uncharacterized protein n=1 Tax=uncultured Caudovirales phage TaxID=2100421 RepID=A0A6J5NV46_9CAUD|nr:hypothetical protein UFOVP729_21 [uncultured Caudovirales phage]
MTYIVENITQKEVNTKFGPKPAFSITANGERYSYGFKKPTFKIGDTIDFQFTENTYGKNVDLTSVRLLSKGEGAPATATAAVAPSKPSYGAAAKVFPIPPLHGDRAIVRQNSITNAVKALDNYLQHAEDTSPRNIDDYANFVIEVARKFEAYSCGDLDLAAAEQMTE